MTEDISDQRPGRRCRRVWLTAFTIAALFGASLGCGTTRMTDTARAASEMLLVSNAIDEAVAQLDLNTLAGKSVYLDTQYLDATVDKGYLISSLRQHMLAHGCTLLDDKAKANYVVEVRAGGVGTDKYSLLIGIPQMSVPTLVPGMPSQIPEIPFAKKTDQQGVAKIALFAYNRNTGKALWQSGMVEAMSTARDTWVFGAGPFRRGTISKGTEFAGEHLPLPTFQNKEDDEEKQATIVPKLTRAASWREPPPPVAVSLDDRPTEADRAGKDVKVVDAKKEDAARLAAAAKSPMGEAKPMSPPTQTRVEASNPLPESLLRPEL